MKRYSTLREIIADRRFLPSNPVTPETYRRMDGVYAFDEGEEARCCVQKQNGKLCETIHRKGWVVELANGTTSLIGGDCATDKFGADSIIGRDISIARNAIDQQERLERLAELLRERDVRLAELSATKDQLVDVKRKLGTYRESLGREAWKRLTEMSRSQTGTTATITATGIIPATYNTDGEVVREKQLVPIFIARLNAVGACNETRLKAAINDVSKIEAAFRQAPSEATTEIKSRETRALSAALADRARVTEHASSLLEQFARFEANDFSSLIFLVTDVGERTRIMRFSLERQGKSSGKEVAKSAVQAWFASLKQQHQVSTITVSR